MLGGVPFEEFTLEDIAGILQDPDFVKLDVVVSETAYSPSIRLATQMSLTEMASQGMPIPPQSVIELMDIPDAEKKKLIQAIQEQQAAQGQAESDKSRTEINKTLIAKDIIPPEIQEEFRLSEATYLAGNSGGEPNVRIDQGNALAAI